MAHWAKVGAKCILVNPHPLWATVPEETPVMGVVYTVRAIFDDALLLQEIVNPDNYVMSDGRIGEPCFLISRFKPAVSQDDDIAMFKAIADRGLAQNGIQVSSPEHEVA